MKHGKLYWLSVVATMLIAVGCDESSTSTICTDNTWNCDDNVLYKCVSGNWKSVKKCHEGTTCNQGAAACIEDETRDAQCLENEHIFAEQCEPDDVNHCGSHFNDCTKMAGWKSGKCIDKTCIALECATGYHLASRTDADSKAIAICDEDTHDACGSANMKCDADQICTQGVCSNTCRSGEVVCKGSCINPKTNAKYCGADASCMNYTACSETEQCIAGKCVISSCTNPEESLCRENGQRICVNIYGNNLKHCGGCGATCSNKETAIASGCNYGRCTYTCKDDMVNCGTEIEPICLPNEQLKNDAQRCGDCNTKCNENELCQNGQCVINSCLENACLYNNACINRTDKCGKQCMNCNSDNHALTGLCQDGTCITLSCVAGYHLYENTCEPDSLEHCGAHGNACNVEGATNICANGKCSSTCKEGYGKLNGSCLPAMISTWEVTSNNLNVAFPIQGRAGAIVIDWGDDTRSEIASGDAQYISHAYLNTGIYVITVFGTIEKWSCCKDWKVWSDHCLGCNTCDKLLSIRSFGNVAFDRCAFARTKNLESMPTKGTAKFYDNDASYAFYRSSFNNDISGWDTSSITNMSHMFQETSAFNQPIENWDVSNVTDMSAMFAGRKHYNSKNEVIAYTSTVFNQPLNNWDVSSVKNMSEMFSIASAFNQPLDNWNVSNVTDMSAMFEHAEAFDQPLENWNVSNVTNMSAMFYQAYRFDHSLNNWNVSNVTNMSAMFRDTSHFNQPLDNWDVSNVTDMSNMFYQAYRFNHSLNNWNVSNVTNMKEMFSETSAFNKPLENWDVSNVIDMWHIFYNAKAFNQPLNNWDVSKVTNMKEMFSGASAFNKPLNNWNVSNVTNMSYMFQGARAFNQTLNNWDVSNVTNMEGMFEKAEAFNQPLNNWNVSNVTNMYAMFMDASAFNQPLNNWNVFNVTYMTGMFKGAKAFNQPLNNWKPRNVISMSGMFEGAEHFNQRLDFWPTENVTNLSYMFSGASAFNQPLFSYLSNVTDMSYMFSGASAFNQPLYWNTSNVKRMNNMFDGARAFNQWLFWDVSNVTNMEEMFKDARTFNQPLDEWRIHKYVSLNNIFSGSGLNYVNFCKTLKSPYSTLWSSYGSGLGLNYVCK